jgi:hypothetical protein
MSVANDKPPRTGSAPIPLAVRNHAVAGNADSRGGATTGTRLIAVARFSTS